MSNSLLAALEVLEQEKGVSKEIIMEAIEQALISAYKKNYGHAQNVEIEFDKESDKVLVIQVKEVVEEVEDDTLHISLADALEINKAYEPGDKIRFEVTPENFGRIAAQTAKQVITQRVREEERNIIYNEFIEYEDDLMQGVIERIDNRYVYVNLGKIEAVLSSQDQIPNEDYRPQERIKVYVSKVEKTTKGPQIFVSRTHPNMIKRLFEQEVPEIFDGTVEIMSIAREAGDRSKLAVASADDNIDPVGTCVGPRGQRVQAVVNELNGENMDIVEWSKDPALFISNALNPAEVLEVHFMPEQNSCIVVVPDDQLSLAIGKRGQNVRLAAKLTGHKIDIKSASEAAEIDFEALIQEAEEARLAEEAAEEAADPAALKAAQEAGQGESIVEVEAFDEYLDDKLEEDEFTEDVVEKENYESGDMSPEQAEDMADLSEDRNRVAREDARKEASEIVLEEEAQKDSEESQRREDEAQEGFEQASNRLDEIED